MLPLSAIKLKLHTFNFIHKNDLCAHEMKHIFSLGLITFPSSDHEVHVPHNTGLELCYALSGTFTRCTYQVPRRSLRCGLNKVLFWVLCSVLTDIVWADLLSTHAVFKPFIIRPLFLCDPFIVVMSSCNPFYKVCFRKLLCTVRKVIISYYYERKPERRNEAVCAVWTVFEYNDIQYTLFTSSKVTAPLTPSLLIWSTVQNGKMALQHFTVLPIQLCNLPIVQSIMIVIDWRK